MTQNDAKSTLFDVSKRAPHGTGLRHLHRPPFKQRADRFLEIVHPGDRAGNRGAHPQVVNAAVVGQMILGVENRGFRSRRGVSKLDQFMIGVAEDGPWKPEVHHMAADLVRRFGPVGVDQPELNPGVGSGETSQLGGVAIGDWAIASNEKENTGLGPAGKRIAGVAAQIQCGGQGYTGGHQENC